MWVQIIKPIGLAVVIYSDLCSREYVLAGIVGKKENYKLSVRTISTANGLISKMLYSVG